MKNLIFLSQIPLKINFEFVFTDIDLMVMGMFDYL